MRPCLLLLLVLTCLTACAPAVPASSTQGATAPSSPKRVKAVVMAELPGLISKFERVLPGSDTVEQMVAAGMVVVDDTGRPRAQLAQDVPSIENGLWKVAPDGSMEMDWKLRPGLTWHDGSPLTADDLLFTLTAATDPEVASLFGRSGYDRIESFTSPDQLTLVVRWKATFIEADRILSPETGARFFGPLPRHLLGRQYAEAKTGMLDLTYWAQDYVGAGPYRVKHWAPGTFFVLQAFDGYALGRPKIDEFEVQFAPDANAAISRILSGDAEILLGRGLDLTQATDAAAAWPDGKMDFGFKSWIVTWPQMLNPNPAIITNLQFRRALLHATDRQQVLDTFLNGLTSVAHTYLSPKEPEYPAFKDRVTYYEYDPRRAAQMLNDLGYVMGSDGFLRDGGGEPLTVEVRTTAENTLHRPTTLALQDYWQKAGVHVDVNFIPAQRQRDNEYRANKPGFELLQGRNDLSALSDLHSRVIALPENNYFGSNNARYASPAFDSLIGRYFGTISKTDRIEIVAQIVIHISENLNAMGLFYSAEFSLISNRLTNAHARQNGISNQTWNVPEWDVK